MLDGCPRPRRNTGISDQECARLDIARSSVRWISHFSFIFHNFSLRDLRNG